MARRCSPQRERLFIDAPTPHHDAAVERASERIRLYAELEQACADAGVDVPQPNYWTIDETDHTADDGTQWLSLYLAVERAKTHTYEQP